jgi:hypothetical protein
MADIELHDIDNRILMAESESEVIKAAATVANAIHAGLGACIKGTLMEQELRDALGLKAGDMINIPRS